MPGAHSRGAQGPLQRCVRAHSDCASRGTRGGERDPSWQPRTAARARSGRDRHHNGGRESGDSPLGAGGHGGHQGPGPRPRLAHPWPHRLQVLPACRSSPFSQHSTGNEARRHVDGALALSPRCSPLSDGASGGSGSEGHSATSRGRRVIAPIGHLDRRRFQPEPWRSGLHVRLHGGALASS